MKDIDEYYNDYFNDTYDMIFGHGMVNEVVFGAKSQQSEVTMSRAPVFKTEKLISICKGPIFFGHIHKHQVIKDDMFYVGSYSRWCFGEEEPKGFMTVEYNTGDNIYDAKFIENEYVRLFATIVVDYNSSFYRSDPNQQIEYIISLAKGTLADKVRIIFNIPEDYEQPTLLINLINEIFAKQSDIKVVINNNAKDIRNKKALEEKVTQLLNTYDFLFDKGIPTDEKLVKYIKLKYNKDIDIETMRDILYQKLSTNIE
jgi:DNA repair exonuclease SbcCD nuclease subunit